MNNLVWHSEIPESEFSLEFIQHMANAMGMSYFKYGKVEDAKGKFDLIESLEKRLEKYRETGNGEWLVDVANFAMIEFMIPSHAKAHFQSTDSGDSPGRKLVNGEFTTEKNLEV